MLRKRGRPKENTEDVRKINPVNTVFGATTTTSSNPSEIIYKEIVYKCDNPKCNSKAEVFINLRYCPLCAKDKGF